MTAVTSGNQLPSEIVDLLGGTELDKAVGFTVQLLTADPAGWPRMALLSAGEILALDAATVRMALWPQSRTTANMTRSGQATLAFVFVGTAYTARAQARCAPDLTGPPTRAVFDCQILELRRDDVPYASLTSGVTFSLLDPVPTVARWRSTIQQLRRHPSEA